MRVFTLAKDSPASSLRIRASTPQEKLSAQTSRTSEERRRYSSSGEQGRSLSPSRTPDNIPRARSPLSSISGISGRGKKNKRPAPASTQSDSSVVEHDQLDSGSDAAAKPRGGGLSLSRIGEDTVPDLSKEGEGRRQKRSMFRLSLDMKSPQGSFVLRRCAQQTASPDLNHGVTHRRAAWPRRKACSQESKSSATRKKWLFVVPKRRDDDNHWDDVQSQPYLVRPPDLVTHYSKAKTGEIAPKGENVIAWFIAVDQRHECL